MSSYPSSIPRTRQLSSGRRIAHWFARHWFASIMGALLLWTGLPFVAPLAMHWGWTGLATAIYSVYSFQCHQLPERSFFLFGSKSMYSLAEIQAAWVNTNNPLVLRQFIGNPEMGWKVAWSDRMVAMFTSIPVLAMVYYPFRRRIRPLPIWAFVLMLVPVGVDGVTHMLSDATAVANGSGFRDANLWLAGLTRNTMPEWFYVGNALGSFNSWMRILSGVLFALGLVWLSFPYLRAAMRVPATAAPAEGSHPRR
jgi:uncharacterized membrane protein